MSFWDKIKKPLAVVGGGIIGGPVGSSALDVMDGNKYRADETTYDPYIKQSGQNSLTLQDALIAQMNGGGPNLAGQQFQNNLQQIQASNAGAIGGIRGINPAAQARMLMQQNAQAQGQASADAATQRMQQQLLAQQQLGQQSLGMFDIGSSRKLGAQQVNAGITSANQQAKAQMVGGALNAAGSVMGMMAGGGEVPDPNGPQSELARFLGGLPMQGGGTVPGAASVPGNSYANDTTPIMASPGEIVIPRTHATPEGAAAFVAALQARQKPVQRMAGGGFVQALGRGC